MKKTYINPNMVVVRLAMTKPLATSDPNVRLNLDDSVDAGDVEAKAYNPISGKNVWDTEW
jgi:hypothetical protein